MLILFSKSIVKKIMLGDKNVSSKKQLSFYDQGYFLLLKNYGVSEIW